MHTRQRQHISIRIRYGTRQKNVIEVPSMAAVAEICKESSSREQMILLGTWQIRYKHSFIFFISSQLTAQTT